MKMQITQTTDKQFIGFEFDALDNPIVLSDDVAIPVERTLLLPDGVRFISSSYVIDAKEI